MASPRGDAASRYTFSLPLLPLHDAARSGNLQRMAVLLVEGHVDVHAKDQDGGWTAVRARPRCAQGEQRTPTAIGCARHCAYTRPRAPLTACGRVATSPGRSRARALRADRSRGVPLLTPPVAQLHLACREGHLSCVEALLDSGAHPDVASNGGWRALHCAAAGGHADVCQSLLARGCEVACATAEGDTPLHWAARTGSVDISAALLAAGAPPLPGNSSGATPLHTAAGHGATAVVLALLAAGGSGAADVTDRGSSTPLHAAAAAGHLETAQALLRAGASLNVVSNTGFTPLNHASENGHVEVAQLLMQAGATARSAGWLGCCGAR
jgi:ankyrin repeat protein